MNPLAVFGTGSDAGKTTVTMALCRIFSDSGLKVAPFKAQNVSNNSAVTSEGGEIARAQYLQAEAARIEPSHLFNPVLLKSQGNSSVQVIVNGLVDRNRTIFDYYERIGLLKEQVEQAFTALQSCYDLVVAEGAGSPVELNLLGKDLSNSFIAKTFGTRNILVADIERGGVFASIYGTLALMDSEIRRNVIGVVINKFRGDRRFFDDGEKIIKERFGVPVLGVLPYRAFNIDMEDSQSLFNYSQNHGAVKIRIAAVAYPGLSNYNDIDPLMSDPEVEVELIRYFRPLKNFDMVLLPGSKTVIRDLQWLKRLGLFDEIKRFGKPVFGLCGGYQMLCRKLYDPDALEHDHAIVETGLGLIDAEVMYLTPKILKKGRYRLFSHEALTGYEIHYGRIENHPLFYEEYPVAGTHVHGIFDNDDFRSAYFRRIDSTYGGYSYPRHRNAEIQRFADMVKEHLDMDKIVKAL